ncbi:MAG: DegT/DnrJ/EryC1/StrS family aminotransferase [Ruminococcus sp.]|nr:DegT/DnrJ/EryC1/StrS family aminotransferase [Ruminococcus sp.]
MVDFIDLKRQYDLYAAEYEKAALRAMRSGWYIMGNELKAFEKQFAEYMGVDYCIGVNSGLDALILAVRALDIGPGDEVIVPANTYIASVLSVTENGATPIFVEPDEFYCLDADKIEKAITERTKAILPVHLYGQPVNMEKICEIADRHGLYVIEDCAQCHGAKYNGQMTGTFGTIGCFSFYPTKPLGALGDSGALITNDKALAEKLFKLRNYGSGVKYVNEMTGKNSRMDELQAALLQVGLSHLDEGNNARIQIAERYLNEINNPNVTLPVVREGATHVYHVFALRCENRDALQAHMMKNDIKTLIHYPIPPHMQQCYTELGHKKGDFSISETYAVQELSLPIYAGMPDEEVTQVIAAVNSFQGEDI